MDEARRNQWLKWFSKETPVSSGPTRTDRPGWTRCIVCQSPTPRFIGADWLYLCYANSMQGPFCDLKCKEKWEAYSHRDRMAAVFGEDRIAGGEYLRHALEHGFRQRESRGAFEWLVNEQKAYRAPAPCPAPDNPNAAEGVQSCPSCRFVDVRLIEYRVLEDKQS